MAAMRKIGEGAPKPTPNGTMTEVPASVSIEGNQMKTNIPFSVDIVAGLQVPPR
jgi:hypothetical protein